MKLKVSSSTDAKPMDMMLTLISLLPSLSIIPLDPVLVIFVKIWVKRFSSGPGIQQNCILLNNLPSDIKSSSSVAILKSKLYLYYTNKLNHTFVIDPPRVCL